MSASPKLKIINGHAYANSIEIAKRFNKQHKDVLRAIENRLKDCSEDFSRRNFTPSDYKNERGKIYPIYQLSRDGFAFIAMNFTGKEAAIWQEAFLSAFNEMEAELQRRNLKEGKFHQLNLFPALQQTIDETRPIINITGALTVLAYEGLMIPLVTREHIIALLKRRTIEGFFDGRNWQIYQDSFESFLHLRRTSVSKAA